MDKYFIAMLTDKESESNLYYVNDDYAIKKVKNDVTPEVYDKETLEEAKEHLKHLVRLNETLSEAYKFNNDTIEALKTAISTINDILMLYNNN
jgi:hypothetical protein